MSQIVSIRLHLSFRLFLLFALLGVFILFSPTKVADAVFCDSGYCNPDVEDACFYQGFDCDGVCVLDQEPGTWGCGGDGVIPAYTCSMPIERCETQPPPPSSSSPPPPGFVNLNFTVRDACSSSGISGATVQVDRDFGNGTTRTTDGGGFASFGVARNTSNIGWSVSAGGYNNGSGTASTNTLDVNVPVSLNRTAGCGGGPPPPPPPPPPPGVTCSLSFSPSTIDEGLSSTAIWNTNDADGSIPYSCNGSGIPSPGTLGGASGSTPVTPTNSQTCIITVQNSSGLTGQCQGSITVANPIPTTSNVSVTMPNYCVSGPTATVGWSYSDPSGSPQLAYQVQIDNQGSFNSPEVDSGKVTCQNCRSYFGGSGILQFNTTYQARVRTWNTYDSASSWQEATICNGTGCQPNGSWRTPTHAYPNVNSPYQFSWSPPNPAVNNPVQFTDRTWFAPSSNNRAWSWTFVPAGGGSGSSTAQNPVYTFNSEGIYQVTERVRDNALPPGQYCTGPTQAVNIQKPIPIWIEVAPR